MHSFIDDFRASIAVMAGLPGFVAGAVLADIGLLYFAAAQPTSG
jgi:hypothetical protein